MNTTTGSRFDQDVLASDINASLESRQLLEGHHNLRHWYEQLYRYQNRLAGGSFERAGKTLEIGSGTSPLKSFYPLISTSDVMPLPHLDFVLDCQEIAEFDLIANRSLEAITLTNVLHHLQDPMAFLHGALSKLGPRGRVIITEPFLSPLSYPILNWIHHEPVDTTITEPRLAGAAGPLSSSNQAMPWLIFHRNPTFRATVEQWYEVSPESGVDGFSSLSYFATGGISKKLPIPAAIYKPAFKLDRVIAASMPRLFASFFTVVLAPREN